MSRISTICLFRLIRLPPTRACTWMQMKSRDESMFLGTSMGGFSIRCTTLATESACVVEYVTWPVPHCLEKSLAFLATDLTHDDVLGTLSHRGPQEFIHIDLPPPGRIERVPRDTRDPVRVREFHFAGIFEGDNLRHRRDEERDRVQCRCLTGRSPPAKMEDLPFSTASHI